MKRILFILVTAAILAGCSDVGKGFDLKVTKDGITWMNGVVRFQAESDKQNQRKHNPAFQAYAGFQDGKTVAMPSDTYALGFGASCPMGTSGLYKPEKGFSQAEILIQTDQQMVIHLHHDPWVIIDQPVTLDKQITLFRDSPIMAVIDYYEGRFDLLNIAAGLSFGNAIKIEELENGFAVDYHNGMTAVLVMPNANEKTVNKSLGSVFTKRAVESGEPLRYYVGISDKGKEFLLEELTKIL